MRTKRLRRIVLTIGAMVICTACKASKPVTLFSNEIADWRGELTACEVHNLALREDTVHVVYGFATLEAAPRGYLRASFELFPNANIAAEGGCVIVVGKSPKAARVLYCPDCRRVEKTWREEAPKEQANAAQ